MKELHLMGVSVPTRGLFNLTAGYNIDGMVADSNGKFPSPSGDYLI